MGLTAEYSHNRQIPLVMRSLIRRRIRADGRLIRARESDAALISALVRIRLGFIARTTAMSGCEDCLMPITVDAVNPWLQITSRKGNVIENEFLEKIGQNSGWTRGKVEDSCADYDFDGWVRICSDRVDYSAVDGDSGSPVFSPKADGTVELRGIHFGRVGWPYNDALMSNLNQIEKDLGPLTVLDPGPPSISIFGASVVRPDVECPWSAGGQFGIPPQTIQWSGVLSGTGGTIWGMVQNSGWLNLTVTDGVGRQAFDSFYITVDPDAPPPQLPPAC